jgi:DNA-binding NtrC family response regulator
MIVSNALKHTGGNQARASGILGLSRVTLRTKLRARGLVVEKQVATRSPVEDAALIAH